MVVREKETFRWEVILDIEGHDTWVYVKASVNYERQSFKITPIITLIHGWDDDVQEQFLQGIEDCRAECERRLEAFRGEVGAGKQHTMDFGTAASASN